MKSNQVKFLFIHTYYKQRGGEDLAFEREVALLKAQGFDVEVLTFTNRRYTILKFFAFPFNLFSYIKVLRAIRKFKPGIVHVHNFFFAASPSIFLAIKRCKVPCVLTVHNFRFFCPSGSLYHKNAIYKESIGAKFPWRAIKDKVFNHSMLATFLVGFSFWLHTKLKTWNKIQRIVFLNPFAMELFKQHNPLAYSNELSMKFNFVDDPKILERVPGKRFLYVGRLSQEKGIEFLLETFSGLDNELLIIGDGPLQEKVLQFSKQRSNIKYLGRQDQEVIFRELHNSSALILCSTCMEMAPLTHIEAMATGTPVIAADVDTLKSFVFDNYNGLLFGVNNVDSLRKAIARFGEMTDVQKDQMRKNARLEYESKFTKEGSLKSIVRMYDEVVSAHT